jgi:RimJ/RimL family protein N-acetyltransferase
MRDAPRLAEIANDKDVAENLSFPHPYTLDDARAWITRTRAQDARGNVPALFCIVAKQGVPDGDGAAPADGVSLVGGIGLTPDPEPWRAHSADLGYFLGRAYWGTGFVSEAGFALLARAFGDEQGAAGGSAGPLQRLQTRVAASNEASIRLLTRLGFRQEARLHKALLRDGVGVDELVQVLTREEWERNQQESDEEELVDDDEEPDTGYEMLEDDEEEDEGPDEDFQLNEDEMDFYDPMEH